MKKMSVKKSNNLRQQEARLGLIFVLIPLCAWTFFEGFPVVMSFAAMFGDIKNYNIITFTWNNFESFKFLFSNSQSAFWTALGNTLFVTSAQFVSLAVALICAVLLNQNRRFGKVYEVMFFVPYVCSAVAVAIMWRWMFNEDAGVINNILVNVFGESARVHWMTEPKAYRWMLFIITVWKEPGYGIIMYKAALKNIDQSLYEAGRIDGANEWQLFKNITFPKLGSTTFFLLLAGIISGMKCFDIAKIVSPLTWTGTAGPDNSGLTLVYYAYLQGVTWDNISIASVISWVLFVIILILTLVNMKAKKYWGGEE